MGQMSKNSSDSNSRNSESDSNTGSSSEHLKKSQSPAVIIHKETPEKEIEQCGEDKKAENDKTIPKEEVPVVEDPKPSERLLTPDTNKEDKPIEEAEPTDRLLTPEMIERKQQSERAQRNFSEALRENKKKFKDKKKKITIDENSIVSRILGEVGKSSSDNKEKKNEMESTSENTENDVNKSEEAKDDEIMNQQSRR